MKITIITVLAACTFTSAAAAQERPERFFPSARAEARSDFDRMMRNASQEARERGERERSAAAQREGDRRRAEAGVGHEGRVPVGDRASLSGSAGRDSRTGETRAEINIRVDIDRD